MGFLFAPGNATAPTPVYASTQQAQVAPEDGEPSKRLATSHEVAPTLTVSLTSYNAVPGQTDGDPTVTASGAYTNPEVVAARSQDLAAELPFGTVIAIERAGGDTNSCGFSKVEHLIGYRVIADTMNARFTDKLDVLFDADDTVTVHGVAMNPSRALGVCGTVTARIVGHVDIKHMPESQAELQAMFGSDGALAINR